MKHQKLYIQSIFFMNFALEMKLSLILKGKVQISYIQESLLNCAGASFFESVFYASVILIIESLNHLFMIIALFKVQKKNIKARLPACIT